MTPLSLHALVCHVRKLAAPHEQNESDQELLERFLNRRDENAFALLVRRHGPMVQGVCKRLLGRQSDADDVFQATFLVLIRRAGSILKRQSLASWLYGVAWRIAREARKRYQAYSQLATDPATESSEDPVQAAAWRELCSILDDELQKLPDRYRSPLVLCYLEGQTRDDAARQLGWSLRTMGRRLERARELLRLRLARRGVTLPAALLVAGLTTQAACAALPAVLINSVVHSATCHTGVQGFEFATLQTKAGLLAQYALKNIALGRIKFLAAILAAGGIALAGGSVLVQKALEPDGTQDTIRNARQTTDDAAHQTVPLAVDGAKTDVYGDPLPAGAIARLGTTRWCLDGDLTHCMVVSQDGKKLFTANPATGIGMWDMATGRLTRQLPVEAAMRQNCLPGRAVAISADGHTAALVWRNGTVSLLDLPSGNEKQRILGGSPTFDEHPRTAHEAALSANGRVLVTRSTSLSVYAWDAGAWKMLRRFRIHQDLNFDQIRPVGLALAPDGKTLAWVGGEPSQLIHICDTISGKEFHALGEHKGQRRHIAISPDGQKLVSTSDGDPVQIWDVKTGMKIRDLPYFRKFDPASAAFTLDSRALVLALGQDAMRSVDVTTGTELWCVPRRSGCNILDVFGFTPDGKSLVATHLSGAVIHRYDVATGKRIPASPEVAASFHALAFSPDEQSLYSLNQDGMLHSWESNTGKELRQVSIGPFYGCALNAHLLAVINASGLHVHETATGKELWQAGIAHLGQMSCCAFSDNGQLLAVARDRSLLLLEAATGKEVVQIANAPSRLNQITFRSSGKDLIGHEWLDYLKPGAFHVWDATTGRERRTLILPPHWQAIALSPDGRVLAVPLANWSGIDFYEVASGRRRFAIDPPTVWPCGIGFSADGRFFLVGGQDGSIRFHDAFSGRLVLHREGHRGTVTDWTFSPSGRRLATISRDSTALVWNMPGVGRPRATNGSDTIMNAADLATGWTDLAAEDAARAHQAITRLIAAQVSTIPFLRGKLAPVPLMDQARLSRLLADLDNNSFAVRDGASRELENLRGLAEPALRKALASKPSLEARQRVEQLLQKLQLRTPDELRFIRAVEILEHIGTAGARQVLQFLAGGAANALLTQEATAAVKRLSGLTAG